MFQAFLIKYGEIGVKGKNRYVFENALVDRMKEVLAETDGTFHIIREQGRIYVEAEGNYVKIVYRKNEKCTQKMLRATMKQVEEVSRPFSYIVKSHRAFLVNLCAVSKVSGNSQGYRLFLYDCEDSIPVSRAYSKEVKMLIEKMNNR